MGAAIARADSSDNTLYMLTYDHGGLVLWGMDHFRQYLHSAAEWMDRYPSFKIGLDNEAYTYDYMAEHDPELLEELRGMLTRYRGRFGIGTCTYGQPLMHFLNEESNIRQIGYGLETDSKYFGTAPDIYLMSEHAMHSQIPQILAGLGFKGAIMRTHFMMYGYNPQFDVAIGWWVGAGRVAHPGHSHLQRRRRRIREGHRRQLVSDPLPHHRQIVAGGLPEEIRAHQAAAGHARR